MSMKEGTLQNEEAAEYRTNIEGWICKTCRRFYGKEEGSERTARYCCEKDHACGTEGCAGRSTKPYIYCDPCIKARDIAKWKELPQEAWDGEVPLVLDDDDKYFWGAEELSEYLYEEGLKLDDVRLVFAEKDGKPSFEMQEFLSDYLCEDNQDALPSSKKIDATVNRWIDEHCPATWLPAKKRPTLASLKDNVTERSEVE